MVLIIGISGASGSIYGIRLLKFLKSRTDIQTHLIITEAGAANIMYETGWNLKEVCSLASFTYDIHDIGARLASGSFKNDGMIISPCSVKTLSAVAHSYTDNLLVRSADVTLKERRRLVLVLRETPLHLGHIRNMEKVAEMGGIILPPVPAFYHKPNTIEDIVDHTVGKILDVFDIEHTLYTRWQGF